MTDIKVYSMLTLQVGLEFSASRDMVTVALYKCRLLNISNSEFDHIYLKTVHRWVV